MSAFLVINHLTNNYLCYIIKTNNSCHLRVMKKAIRKECLKTIYVANSNRFWILISGAICTIRCNEKTFYTWVILNKNNSCCEKRQKGRVV